MKKFFFSIVMVICVFMFIPNLYAQTTYVDVVKSVDVKDYDGTYSGVPGSGTHGYSVLYRDHYLGAATGGEGNGAHPGIDITCPSGTSVKSIADGIVFESENNLDGWGGLIIIRHDNISGTSESVYSIYAHLKQRNVEKSVDPSNPTTVSKGDIIGLSGGDLTDPYHGASDGPHLHFQIDRTNRISNNSSIIHPYWPTLDSDPSTNDANIEDVNHVVEDHTYHPMHFLKYRMTIPVGFYSTGWNTGGTSQKFVDYFNSNPGIGSPHDNGGTPFVHEWYGVYLQDFYGENNGFYEENTALVLNPSQTEVFLLNEGFRNVYMNLNFDNNTKYGPQVLGALTSNEDESLGYPKQTFANGYMTYDENDNGKVRAYLYGNSTPIYEEPTQVSMSGVGGGVYQPETLGVSSVTSSRIDLTWQAGLNNEYVTYYVYRGGTQIGSTVNLSYVDNTVSSGNTYTYYVTANMNGEESEASNTVSVTAENSIANFPLTVEAESMDGPVNLVTDGVKMVRPGGWFICKQIGIPQYGLVQFEVIAKVDSVANSTYPTMELKYCNELACSIDSTEFKSFYFTKYFDSPNSSWSMEINLFGADGSSIVVDKVIVSFLNNVPPPTYPNLELLFSSPVNMEMGFAGTKNENLWYKNYGDASMQGSMSIGQPFSLSEHSINLAVSSMSDFYLSVDSIETLQAGLYQDTLFVYTNGGNDSVLVNFEKVDLDTSGNLIYVDDFSRSGLGSIWNIDYIDDGSDGAIEIENNQMYLHGDSPGTTVQATVNNLSLQDARISFYLDNGSSYRDNNATFILARYQDEDNYYYTLVREDSYAANRQKVEIYKKVAGVVTLLASTSDGVQLLPGGYEFIVKNDLLFFRNTTGATDVSICARDSSIDSAGKVGFRINEEVSHVDDLRIYSTDAVSVDFFASSCNSLDFGDVDSDTVRMFTIRNYGTDSLGVNVAESPDVSWITSISPNSGNIASGDSLNITIVGDRSSLSDSTYYSSLIVFSAGLADTIDVSMTRQLPRFTGWTNKAKLTIDNTKVAGTFDLNNFPVLIDENCLPSEIFTVANSDGGDIRFSSDSLGTNELAREIALFDVGQTISSNIFEDNFNRDNSGSVGNGWSEVEYAGGVMINSNNLLCGPDGSNEGHAAVAYRARPSGFNYKNTTLEWSWHKGSEADNYYEWAGVSVSHNGSTRNAGVGLHVFFSLGNGKIWIRDGSTQKVSINYAFSLDTWYYFRWDIEDDGSMRLYVKDGNSDFTVSDLVGTVSAFTINSTNPNWALGNVNVDRFDYFKVYDSVLPPEPIMFTDTEMWVQIPIITHDTDTDFYVWYGNPNAADYDSTDTYGSQNVWTNTGNETTDWITTEQNNQNSPSGFISYSICTIDTTEGCVESPPDSILPALVEFDGWLKRSELIIDHTKVSGNSDLIDFPVLLTEDNLPTDIFTSANSDGGDIRFSLDESGTNELVREIVYFSNPKIEIWVKLPSIDVDTNTIFYIWYGNSNVTDYSPADTCGGNAVWLDYTGIYHFQGILNSTSKKNNSQGASGRDLSEVNSLSSGVGFNGINFGAYSFGNSGYLEVGNQADFNPGTGQFMVQCWAKSTSVISSFVSKKANCGNVDYFIFYAENSSYPKMQANVGADENAKYAQSNIVFNDGSWHLITGIRDGDNLYFYQDGVLAGSGLGVYSYNINSGEEVWIGRMNNSYMNGEIDEVRIINGSLKTSDWIATEYANQNLPATFVTTGTPVTLSKKANNIDQKLPTEFALYQNYPNPFNPVTQIVYDLPECEKVELMIYNMLGQQIRTLINEEQLAGKHTINWGATTDNGIKVATGVYFYVLKAGGFRDVKKMLLIQ